MWQLRQRKGLSLDEARRQLFNGNYFGSCMVARGDADALLSGANLHYPETIRPALQVIGAHPASKVVSGMYMLVTDHHVVFCADTTVNIDPTAEQLAQIGYAASRVARTMGVTPRVAMLSFSNFGSVKDPSAAKMAQAAQMLRERDPSIVVDGEMQADTALDPEILSRDYPFNLLKEQANVLVFPNLSAGNIAYKLVHVLGGATAIGPILLGMRRPVHVLERGADVQDIVNMAAVAVVDAQERSQQSGSYFAVPAPTQSDLSPL
jgi:malate dehydrogenase (oxaloacetate-decarboxylating)(NADP+)